MVPELSQPGFKERKYTRNLGSGFFQSFLFPLLTLKEKGPIAITVSGELYLLVLGDVQARLALSQVGPREQLCRCYLEGEVTTPAVGTVDER